ncbi:protein CROWDED NUCLEI 1-like isoform X2 [Aristolochia californica]|uniref:protein CROWDED NUCLEI 1-like isoform X2 n=1 Tax=Aristolochia californica TaxID=171875 RepID=UPI0035E08283
MFTPRMKGWPGRSPAPRTDDPRTALKGKSVAAVEATPPPPLASLGQNGANTVPGVGGGESEVWRRFRDAGLLDEASLEKKDREALLQRISKLEDELYDYQYNMGLLLIEKKEWTTKVEELQEALMEAGEIVKREQTAHVVVISDIEKREESLKKALVVEKQCVADLEKALHELRSESAGVKVNSDEKLAEAHALVASVEGKSLEVDAKFRAADAKLAEASRKSTEMDRKLHEVEMRESVLRRERLSFNAEKEAHESALAKQREDLREWEKKLQEGQQRLIDSQGLLNQREARANEKDRAINQKEKDLEDLQKKIEIANSVLKDKEADMSMRLTALAQKEEEYDLKQKDLEAREQELLALQEKLNAREKLAVQALIDEHNAVLDIKKEEFELEMEKKRVSVDEELKSKVDELKQREAEVGHKEDKLVKREQALEKKAEKLKEKEKEYDSRQKVFKEKEKSVKAEEKALDMEKKRVETDKKELLNLRTELAKDRVAMEEKVKLILKEQEHLKVTEDEKREYLVLQSKLKDEREECRLQKELLIKEREELVQDRQKIERDWEVLDEKNVLIETEKKHLKEEKEKFDKWKEAEKERMEREKLAAAREAEEELETLKLERETLAARMEQERSELFEKTQRERDDMLHDFELRKCALETSVQSLQEEVERQLHEKEKAFMEEREKEMNHINSLREQAQREMEEMKLGMRRLETEREDLMSARERLERDRHGIQNDIEELRALSRKVRDQREEFVKERQRVLDFIEQNKTCKNCGTVVLSDLQPLLEFEDSGPTFPSRLAEVDFRQTDKVGVAPDISPVGMGTDSGGRMSWLRKCTSKIFNLSPVKRIEDAIKGPDMTVSERLDAAEDEPEPSFTAVMSDTADIEQMQSDTSVREVEDGPSPSADERSEMARSQGASEVFSASPEIEESKPLVQKNVPRRIGKKSRKLRATRTMKQVIDESKAILGENPGENKNEEQPNGKHQELAHGGKESQRDSLREDSRASNAGRKRQYRNIAGEQNLDESEARSESVTTGGRRKRRQTEATTVETPGAKRYNFRKSTVAGKASLPQQSAGTERRDHPQSTQLLENDKVPEEGDREVVAAEQHTGATSAGVAVENDNGMDTTGRSIVEIHKEITLEKVETIDNVEFSEGGNQSRDEMNVVEDAQYDGYETEEADLADESEDDSEKHNASIGKKLWNFFTT